MATKTFTWRELARGAIEDILAGLGLHETSDVHAIKAALRDGYPFARREGYPYKAWLAEQRAALARLFPPKPFRPDAPAVKLVTLEDGSPFCLVVSCGWCQGPPFKPCLICAELEAHLHGLILCAEWGQLWESMRTGEAAPAVLADYADDHGYDDVAALLREVKNADAT